MAPIQAELQPASLVVVSAPISLGQTVSHYVKLVNLTNAPAPFAWQTPKDVSDDMHEEEDEVVDRQAASSYEPGMPFPVLLFFQNVVLLHIMMMLPI